MVLNSFTRGLLEINTYVVETILKAKLVYVPLLEEICISNGEPDWYATHLLFTL